MKNSSHPSTPKGFTLIELLVVIAIIAVLASAGFAVGPAMMNKAKKVSAQAGASSISNAVEQFYTEYSALPDPGTNSSDTEFATNASTGVKLLEILAGIDTGDQNSRKIRFLSAKEAKNGRDGIEYNTGGSTIKSMTDPWGQPYYVRLDYDYDERLTVNPGGTGSSTLNGRRVAVFSLGVDKPATATAKTVVRTW